MKIEYLGIEDIKPYENNPRKNNDAVEAVMNSIQEFGFKQPIVVDKDGTIIAGHTRYKAALRLGMEEIPCVRADDLTEEQVRAYRLADNKTGELAEWDLTKLDAELGEILDLDMGKFGFDDPSEVEMENLYTQKTKIPQYEVTGEGCELSECVDASKAEELDAEIERAEGITEDEREFLREAACRHYRFNYKKIAEYYAAASEEMQELMERSALVIIDFNDAMANGYVELCKEVKGIFDEE